MKTAVAAVDELLAHYHRAVRAFLNGNCEPVQQLWSEQDDVTLANPFGPPARGGAAVAAMMQYAAATLRAGRFVGVEIVTKVVTAELAYVVELEHSEAKLGGREERTPFALRATMIFRLEDGVWKVVHRHADPITTARPVESVLQPEIGQDLRRAMHRPDQALSNPRNDDAGSQDQDHRPMKPT